MIVEFYKHGSLLPDDYDAVVEPNGRITYIPERITAEGVQRFVVHDRHGTMPSVLGGPLFRILLAHHIVTVIFYGFDK